MNGSERAWNGSAGPNGSELGPGLEAEFPGSSAGPLPPRSHVTDRSDVRAIFITLYTVVFCCCFFGNLVVILVVTISRRLRSITNFFLANLAVADLCVGVFCVYQNLFLFLEPGEWVLGRALCKLYQFVHTLSYTASILVLVVICLERYVAIIHAVACRQILTPNRLVLVVVSVWCVAALYSVPRLAYMDTVEHNNTTVCVPTVNRFNSLAFDLVNLVLLYVLPLVVMSLLYSAIAAELWHSAHQLDAAAAAAAGPQRLPLGHGHPHPLYPPPPPPYGCAAAGCSAGEIGPGPGPGPGPAPEPAPAAASFRSRLSRRLRPSYTSQQGGLRCRYLRACSTNGPGPANGGGGSGSVKAQAESYYVSSSQNVLRARRGVVRMLIAVVASFAVFNLPYHARKVWQHGGEAWGYSPSSNFSKLLTPLTFLLTYVNSGINPLLYAFMSRNFRKGLREVVCGPLRGGRPAVRELPSSSIVRRSSTRSTSRAVSVVTVNPHS